MYIKIFIKTYRIFNSSFCFAQTANNIFLNAMQTLQCCQQNKGILGGAILYNNKYVTNKLYSYCVDKILYCINEYYFVMQNFMFILQH